MIVTTYTCDKCGHEQDNYKQMWEIGISVRAIQGKPHLKWLPTPQKTHLWCRGCVVKLGLLPSTVDDPPAPTPTPTLDDMIMEIVHEAMDDH